MKNFKITFEEHITQDFVIMADTLEEAMETARKQYKNDELTVDQAELQTTLIAGYDPDEDKMTEWSEI